MRIIFVDPKSGAHLASPAADGIAPPATTSSAQRSRLMRAALACALALPGLVVTSCAKSAPEPVTAGSGAVTPTDDIATPTTTPAPLGVELGDLNRAADPCTDFYEFANGTWRAQNPIPEGKPRWSRRGAARAGNRAVALALVQELASKTDWPAASHQRLVSDHFASCMDEAAIEAAGLTPLQPLLTELEAVKTAADVQRVMRRLRGLGIAAPLGELGAFENSAPENFLLNLVAGGLGLPDREAYVNPEPRFAELRGKYREHIAKLLTLSGMADKAAVAASERILALEKRLATASLDAATASDPAAVEHKTPFARLKILAPRVDWDKYFDEAKIPREPVNVAEPRFLQQVDKELRTTPVADWKVYLRWRLVDTASPWLSKAFAEEASAFHDQVLGGATGPAPRADRCFDLTEGLLGEPVGRAYADKYFPPQAKEKARALSNNLLAVLKERVAGLTWMAADTKAQALAKIASMSVQIGYPDHWKDTSKLVIQRAALWENIMQARRFLAEDLHQQVGRPTNRDGWQLPPSSSAAYLEPQLNELVLPAGFLQPPYFDINATDAANYGALGAGLAHDMTHAFDAGGSLLDAAGRAKPWWTENDRQEFDKRVQCIIDQYEGYEIEPGVHHQGKLVLSEALGDQAGAHVAYLAMKKAMGAQPAPMAGGFTPEQQFFLAYGQFRGEAVTLEAQRQMVKGDSHPVPKFRVIGSLANLVEFQQAFSCKAGSAMVRPAEQRCAVW